MVGSLLAGYELSMAGRRNWLYLSSYIIVLSLALAVITDYEYPRIGLVRPTAFDKVIAQTLEQMK
jgi:hypothetical protein